MKYNFTDNTDPGRIMVEVVLDELDLRIIALLQEDGSLSNLELSERALASPPTCLRRVRRLKEQGVIGRQLVMLDPNAIGTRLTAIVEISLDRQTAEDFEQFEQHVCAQASVTQCYRVSPGPDFVVVADFPDMPAYDAFARRLFTNATNVRNVRTFFSTHRAKFEANAKVVPVGAR